MAYVNFKNSPSEETPLTGGAAGNLNVMQENGTSHGSDTKLGYAQSFLNEHIINVSNEVDEDYKTNIKMPKNLFDGYLVNGYNPTDPSTNTGRLRTNYIKVKPNTIYVCSLIPPTGKTGQFYVYEYTNKGQTPTGKNWKNSGVSFTTGNTTQYISLCLKCTDDSAITPTSFSNIQLEKGNTPSTYVPYSPPSIVVDNEEIYNKDDTKVKIYNTKYENVKFYKIGKMAFLTINTTANTVGSDGALIPIPNELSPSTNVRVRTRYYNGSSYVNGFIEANSTYNIVYIKDDYGNVGSTMQYIYAQLFWVVD